MINCVPHVAVGSVGMPRKYGSYITAGDCLEDFRSWGKIIESLNL